MAWPYTEVLPIVVELKLGDTWVDITSHVIRDAIVVTRGRGDWADDVDPATCELTINNRDGRYSPRNPTGPYYGLLTRNTPIRVGIDHGGAEPDWRFTGELSSLPQRWDHTGTDVHIPVSAAGVLRRLGLGTEPASSSIKLGILGSEPDLAYWPMEDPEGSFRMASALPGGSPLEIRAGTPELASYEGFDCSAPLPAGGDAQFNGRIGGYKATGALHLSWLMHVPENGSVDGESLILFFTTGSAQQWAIRYWADATNGDGAIGVRVRDDEGTILLDTPEMFVSDPNLDKIDGENVQVTLEAQQSGSNVTFRLYLMQVGAQTGRASVLRTVTSATLGRIRHVRLNPGGGHPDVVMGHVVVRSSLLGTPTNADELSAYVGERAGRRIERLCAENDLQFQSLGDLDDTATMGPQRVSTLIELLRECAHTDAGMLYEPRDQLGIGYRTRRSIENQPAQVTLDYDSEHLSQPFEPVDDDQQTRNDVTATRDGGSSSRAVKQTGPMSVAEPPDGVGRYATEITLNPGSDLDLPDHAGWRLNLGTVDEARYPTISVNRARDQFVADPALSQDIVDLDVGDRVDVTDLPAWLPPEAATQIVQGYREDLAQFIHEVTWNCTPASPWQVAVWPDDEAGGDDEAGAPWARFGPLETILAVALAPSGTTVDVDPGADEWTTNADHFPFDIVVGGERMTLTAVSGGGGGTETFVGDGNAATSTASTSHVAPSVTPESTADLLICAWCSFEDVGNYTIPGTMTGKVETDGVFTTLASARQNLASGSATGTRTATFSAADAYSAVSILCHGGGSTPTIEEVVSDVASDAARGVDEVVLTTDAATEVGWWLVAIHGWDWDPAGVMQNLDGFDGVTDSEIGSSLTSRIRVGVARVTEPGAQEVTFPASPEQYDNHARLYVLSGVVPGGLQQFTVTRSVNGVVKSHDVGALVELAHRAVRPLG